MVNVGPSLMGGVFKTSFMRDYKFRGKRIDNGKWVTGWFYFFEGAYIRYCHDTCHFDEGPQNAYTDYEVIPETVGQFTGLKDKTGKEIYEGDILRSFSFSVPSYEVFYHKGCYRLRYKLKSSEWYDWGPLFRMEEIQWEGRLPLCPDVIGNIHDNPELLNPPADSPALNTMNNFDPNVKTEGEVKDEAADLKAAPAEQATEQEGEKTEG